MKTTIGGDRLGSGQKENVSLRNYERSTHDLGDLWRTSMSAGTLVPFMSEVALPGDNWDINLACEVITLPTIGPLFGSYKVQLDVFQIPIRLYNAGLHMNRLGIGNDMSEVFLPQIRLLTNNHTDYQQTFDDNEQINPSCIMKYLGVSGLGHIIGTTNPAKRDFNAVPLLAYWDIYKNYYANKQEEIGYVVHTSNTTAGEIAIQAAQAYDGLTYISDIYNNVVNTTVTTDFNLEIFFPLSSLQPDASMIDITLNGSTYKLGNAFGSLVWDDSNKKVVCTDYKDLEIGTFNITVPTQTVPLLGGAGAQIGLEQFDLENIDAMRDTLLQHPFGNGVYTITNVSNFQPYTNLMNTVGTPNDETRRYACQFSQEGLGIKTYQSDLLNNWISTEWIDGTNGVNEVTKVSTAGDAFTIDALNIAKKVYMMLNRIALSGGTYDDWLDAVYTHERSKSVESPIYHGSLIKELAFEEVISNSESEINGNNQPLGTLAGRGRLTGKHKGGKIRIKVDEPSYIMGIVSLTPRVDYSQGNKWDINLKTMNDLHKPPLDAIGFQDLITEQMAWQDSTLNSANNSVAFQSAGKQPAWINYMTSINRVYGNFADQNKEMFMTLNRRYDVSNVDGSITDLTTYIDPTKFNHIFAQTALDSQNFWVQISKNVTTRRKMSAKVIPNL